MNQNTRLGSYVTCSIAGESYQAFHDNLAGVVGSCALSGFQDSHVANPEGIGWYWDDSHSGPTDANTFAAVREVYFSAAYQGPSAP